MITSGKVKDEVVIAIRKIKGEWKKRILKLYKGGAFIAHLVFQVFLSRSGI